MVRDAWRISLKHPQISCKLTYQPIMRGENTGNCVSAFKMFWSRRRVAKSTRPKLIVVTGCGKQDATMLLGQHRSCLVQY